MLTNNGIWKVEITGNTGWFENQKSGCGGGLWFEGRTLVDHDGTFELPIAVAKLLRELGYEVTEEFCA